VKLIQAQVDFMMSRMPGQQGIVEMTKELQLYAFNVMAATMFSMTFGRDRQQDAIKILNAMRRSQSLVGLFNQQAWAWAIAKYLPGALAGSDEFSQLSQQILEERLQVNLPSHIASLETLMPSVFDRM
jgi:hypothetical protein